MDRTAIVRKRESLPTRWLLKQDLLKGRILDYGCGRGKDAEVLNCEKFDPNYSPTMPRGKFNVIICHYVLNVVIKEDENRIIEDVNKRLRKNGKAYFTVRRDKFKHGFNGRSYQRWSKPKLKSIHKTSDFEMYILER